MFISIGYDISLWLARESAVLFALRVHPSRQHDLVDGEDFSIEPDLPVENYIDSFGNHCSRVHCPQGVLRLKNKAIIRDSGVPDVYAPEATQCQIRYLPTEYLQFLLPSRYCEVDSELGAFAWKSFHHLPEGWARVEAICNFVHDYVTFDYLQARSTRTAVETFRERVGVCRDFTHLAMAMCRSMNIPTRYVTGYLGDIGVPRDPPMDFSAWMEVYLNGRWYSFDPRNNTRRIGRVVIAYGRDASDVAITTVFGNHSLQKFVVQTEEYLPNDAASQPTCVNGYS